MPKDAEPDTTTGGPKWVPIAGELYGCSFERLANPGQFQAFTWKPCADVAGCEEAVFDTTIWFESADWALESALLPTVRVNDDGADVRTMLAITRYDHPVIYMITTDDGRAIDGYRSSKPIHECITAVSLWAKSFAIFFAKQDGGLMQMAHLLGDAGQTEAPVLRPLEGAPPGNPQAYVMGASRWLFWWVLPHQLVTVSNVDGSDPRIVAKSDPLNGPIGELGQPVSAGDHFLYHQWVDNANTPGTHWELAITDGVSAGTPYLMPPAGESYASPLYAHSHVAWMRGINMKGVNVYAAVEVWASPWSPDGTKLTPAKIGDFPLTSAVQGVGGWGYAVTPTSVNDVLLWNLATGAARTLVPPTSMKAFWVPFGITRKHFWTSGRDDKTVNRGDYLLRYSLEP